MLAKNIDQPIFEPLTNQEKKEGYEVHIHISTFTLEDTPVEELNTIQIVTVTPTQQSLESKKQQEEEDEKTDEET